MKVICSHTGKVFYCKDCNHGKEHEPHIFENETDCREKSKCCIVEKVVRCETVEMEFIN